MYREAYALWSSSGKDEIIARRLQKDALLSERIGRLADVLHPRHFSATARLRIQSAEDEAYGVYREDDHAPPTHSPTVDGVADRESPNCDLLSRNGGQKSEKGLMRSRYPIAI